MGKRQSADPFDHLGVRANDPEIMLVAVVFRYDVVIGGAGG
jgi:hypothetical protein